MATTKAEEVYLKVEALMEKGTTKAAAFKQLSEEYQQPLGSIRGFYYGFSNKKSGGKSRPRRRETTAETALEAARASLEKSIEDIDREVEAAAEHARFADQEAKALAASATERKQVITQRLEALR